MSFTQLYGQFREIAERGNEQEARQFLAEHLDEFPKTLKEQIIFAFLEEGVRASAEQDAIIREIQQDGTTAMSELAKMKRQVEDKKKLAELEDKMKR